jgi:hypothetical protein
LAPGLRLDGRAQARAFEIENPSAVAGARADEFPDDETEVGGPAEGVLVGVGCLGDQELVGLVDAGGQARLEMTRGETEN